MKLSANVNLNIKQDLVMTQELRQSINILEYDNLELLDFINKELESNPILELDAPLRQDSYRKLNSNNSFNSSLDYLPCKKDRSIYNQLKRQVSYLNLNKKDKDICSYIIGNLDERGYLDLEDELIKKKFKLDNKSYQRNLDIIQNLEPAGIAARSLGESFKIQLRRKGLLNEIYENFLEEDLFKLVDKSIDELASEIKIPKEKISQILEDLLKLDPYPGRQLEESISVNYIKPDIMISREDGDLRIYLNDSFIPKIYINPIYEEILKKSKDRSEIEYIKEKIKRANWLMMSIESRRQTILKVMSAIVDQQHDFFENNIDYLLPLRLKDIALDINMHESTVSRVVKDKYLQTDRGLYSLRCFFNTAIATDKGNISSYDIKNIIRGIIDSENKNKPYSDEEIRKILNDDIQIDISRRTVTKYRRELFIVSSYKRKKDLEILDKR